MAMWAAWPYGRARAFSAAALVVVLPAIAWTVWNADGRSAAIARTFRVNLLRFMALEGMITPESGILANAWPAYQAARAAAPPLSLVGVPPQVYPILESHESDAPAIFREAIMTRPGAYAAAMLRTAAAFIGLRSSSSDNHLFVSNVLSLSVPQSKCVCPKELEPAFEQTFARPGRRTPVHYLLKVLYLVSPAVVITGWCVMTAAVVLGIRRRDPRWLALCAAPVVYAAAHIPIVFGIDRYAAPTFPIAITAICVIPAWTSRRRSTAAEQLAA
jgi:hypothetical protein